MASAGGRGGLVGAVVEILVVEGEMKSPLFVLWVANTEAVAPVEKR